MKKILSALVLAAGVAALAAVPVAAQVGTPEKPAGDASGASGAAKGPSAQGPSAKGPSTKGASSKDPVAQGTSAQGETIRGTVLESIDAAGFTYLRLKTRSGETWAAITQTPVKKGAEVRIEDATVMRDFESRALNRKFDRIVFGSLAGAPKRTPSPGHGSPMAGGSVPSASSSAAPAGGPPAASGSGQGGTSAAPGAASGPKGLSADLGAMHAGMAKSGDVGEIKVPKATGPDARTVAEIVTRRADLRDKTVAVRGKVVRFTPGVMGRNWLHLRDGTGTAADGTNDVTVTTQDDAKVGDVVLVRGVVRTDRDLGSGYTYRVLVEEAKLQR